MKFAIGDKKIDLYNFSQSSLCPLIIVQTAEKEAEQVLSECLKQGCRDFVLVCISGIDWNKDLSPWPAAAVFKNAEPFAGLADDHLQLLSEKIIPFVADHLKPAGVSIKWIGLAGYSLAGLFSLYAGCVSDRYNRLVSASGSLWYPDFVPYLRGRGLKDSVEKIYLSLGDKEAQSRNQLMSTVELRTNEVYDLLKQTVEVRYELNEGNHFQDPGKRLVKGIAYILKDQ